MNPASLARPASDSIVRTPAGLRTRLHALEAIEITMIGLGITAVMGAVVAPQQITAIGPWGFLLELVSVGVLLTLGPLLAWSLYTGFVVITCPALVLDLGLWLAASALTSGFAILFFTAFDLNRLLVAALLYRGEAPVAYAWSYGSKRRRREWLRARRAITITQ